MADETKFVVRVLMDVKDKVPYIVTMSEDEKTVIEITGANDGGPLYQDPNDKTANIPGQGNTPPPPFGEKRFLVEISDDAVGATGLNVYTLVWPKLEDLKAGKMPAVAKNELPEDLMGMGVAKFPDSLKTEKQIDAENEKQIQDAMSAINRMIGLKNVKDKLRNQIALTRFSKLREEILGADTKKPSLHMVFTGNPGTGKTTIAREYGKVLKAMGLLSKGHIVEVTRKDLVAGFIGQSEEKTQKKIDEAKGGVLFIDEAYALANSGSGKDYGKQVIDQIVAEMENNRDDLVVIVAGYPEPMKQFIESNPGLKSRFLNYVEFPDYDAREIGEIMDMMTEDMQIKLSPRARKEAVALVEDQRKRGGKNFGNGRTARNLLDLAFENAALRVMEGKSFAELKGMSKDKLKSLVTTIKLSDIQNINLDGINSKKSGKIGFNVDLDDADEMEEIVEELQERIEERKHNGNDKSASFSAVAARQGKGSNDDTPAFSVSPAEQLRRKLGM